MKNYGIGGYAGFGGGGFGGGGYDNSDDEHQLNTKKKTVKCQLNTKANDVNQSIKAVRRRYGRRLKKRAIKVRYGLKNFGLGNRRFLWNGKNKF